MYPRAISIKLLLVVGVIAVILQGNTTCADETDTNKIPGIAPDGMVGISNIGLPLFAPPNLTFSALTGYGITESIEPVPGNHHSILGMVGMGATVLPWLSFGANLDLKYDKHPPDEQGSDYSMILDPHITVRAGGKLNPKWVLGGNLKLWIPGDTSPSLVWNASTLDGTIISAFFPSAKMIVAAQLGFRWDNSSAAAPEMDILRSGDRISLNLSDYNAILVGLGFTYLISNISIIGEVSGDILIGTKAPSSRSPFRFELGARYHFSSGIQLQLLTQTSLSKRPEVTPTSPLVPIEPRFSIVAGIAYTLNFKKSPNKPLATAADESKLSKTPKDSPVPIQQTTQLSPPTSTKQSATVNGQIIDAEGISIAGATVKCTSGNKHWEITTDKNGQFTITNIPYGPAKCSVSVDYFDPIEWTEEIRDTLHTLPPKTLTESQMGSQLRGLVRSYSGEPIGATIKIVPSNETTKTDVNGYFKIDLPPGEYTVEFIAPKHRPQKRKIKIEENSVIILNVDLHKKDK